MWDPPRPGIEPLSPALPGTLSTAGPPGKSFKEKKSLWSFKEQKSLLILVASPSPRVKAGFWAYPHMLAYK